MTQESAIQDEIIRIKGLFPGANETRLSVMESLVEQAAYERILLSQLNRVALESGLVKVHSQHADMQRRLPVSGEIAKHAAALTNIMDKLMKHLGAPIEDDDEGLSEYE